LFIENSGERMKKSILLLLGRLFEKRGVIDNKKDNPLDIKITKNKIKLNVNSLFGNDNIKEQVEKAEETFNN
tara:strand:+ start:377 stop:592 length:216 start_codon:yes stop_codon:yes gene_type:complete